MTRSADLTPTSPLAIAEAPLQLSIRWEISGYGSCGTELLRITDVWLTSHRGWAMRVLEPQHLVLRWFDNNVSIIQFILVGIQWFSDSMIFIEMRQGWYACHLASMDGGIRLIPATYHWFWASMYVTYRYLSRSNPRSTYLLILIFPLVRSWPGVYTNHRSIQSHREFCIVDPVLRF